MRTCSIIYSHVLRVILEQEARWDGMGEVASSQGTVTGQK